MKIGTRILHTGNEIDQVTGAVSVPIYHASTFRQKTADEFGIYEYSRGGNPTRNALEGIIANLEGGTRGFAFASGMSAIASVLMIFSPGDHLVVCEDVYGGTYRALTNLFSRFEIETTFVDFSDPDKVKGAIRSNTKALFAETPSNPLLKITDLRAIASIARDSGLISVVDNTFMTPYLQRPLELGFDVVIHSATKYLGGHSDILAGLAVVRDEELGNRIKFIQNCFGAVLGPQDSWLVMRGIKTLKARMELHQRGAQQIAEWLVKCPQVTEVFYPGLPGHPGKAIHDGQADGPGGVVSFRLETEKLTKKFLANVELAALAVSLGAVESIISYPVKMSHAGMHPDHRKRVGVTGDLVRLSVGLEEAEDLIADLGEALEKSATGVRR